MNEQLRQLLTALGLTVADGDEFTPELGHGGAVCPHRDFVKNPWRMHTTT